MAYAHNGVMVMGAALFLSVAICSNADSAAEKSAKKGITHPDWTQSLYQTYDYEGSAALEAKIFDRIQTTDCNAAVVDPPNLEQVVRDHHRQVVTFSATGDQPEFLPGEEIPAEIAAFVLVYKDAIETACLDQLGRKVPAE